MLCQARVHCFGVWISAGLPWRWTWVIVDQLNSDIRKIRLVSEFRNIDYIVIRGVPILLKQAFCMY